jgi:hypothetical protein
MVSVSEEVSTEEAWSSENAYRALGNIYQLRVRQTDSDKEDNELLELHDARKGIRIGFEELTRAYTTTLDSEMCLIALFSEDMSSLYKLAQKHIP